MILKDSRPSASIDAFWWRFIPVPQRRQSVLPSNATHTDLSMFQSMMRLRMVVGFMFVVDHTGAVQGISFRVR